MRNLLNETCLLVVDIQEKFTPHIHEIETTTKQCHTLIQGCITLGMEVATTEQNSGKLGKTISPIKELISPYPTFEKMEFSCWDCNEYQNWLKAKTHIKNIILCGIESHVCVLQTSIDLKSAGYNPIVIWDAISSRSQKNKDLGLTRLIQECVTVSSCESILFELMRTFDHPKAKEISKLVK